MYTCIIYSNSSNGREYSVKTKSAYKAAQIYGRFEYGEHVQIYNKSGKMISGAMYSAEKKKYFRYSI